MPQALEGLIDAAVGKESDLFLQLLIYNGNLLFLFILALFFRSYLQGVTESNVCAVENERVLSDMLRIPFLELKGKTLGHYLHFIESDINKVSGLAFYDITVLVSNVIMTGFMLVYLIRADWILSIVVILIIPLSCIATKIMLPRISKTENEVIAQSEELNNLADTFYTGNDSIKASNAQSFFKKQMSTVIQKFRIAKIKYAKEEAIYDILFVTGFMNIANMLIYCIGGFRVIQGGMSIGVVNTFTLYFSSLWNSVDGIMDMIKQYKVKKLSVQRLMDFHELAEATFENAGEELEAFEKLEVEGISVVYEEKKLMSGCTLTVNKGEKVLIVGDNGSGKTTLARVLAKLIVPQQGRIKYNGTDYVQIGTEMLRKHIRLVPAEMFITEGDFTSNLWEGVNRIPEPKEFSGRRIKKGGSNLSSGQKKIIQLLRALATNADVYIFDEPFNYLDETTKELIWKEILVRFSDKTIIVISHDLYPAKDCTRMINLR